jgi:dolichyl-phosphate beta-glucosyltransferase
LKISLIVPAYNEERRLPGSIARIAEYVDGRLETWDVVVVDDGSTDATVTVAQKASRAAGLPLRVISLPANRGKGAALRAGVLASEGDVVLTSDADLSTPLSEWKKLEGAGSPIAIGSRGLDESTVKVAQPWYRRTMGKIFNRLVHRATGTNLRDTQCGFKLFDGAVARRLFAGATIDRFAYDVEILARAERAGIPVAEVPVLWFNSPESKVHVVRDSFRMLVDLWRIRRALRRRPRADRL